MTAYRAPPRQLGLAPPAPWWRLLRAWLGGTFGRLEAARRRRFLAYLMHPPEHYGITWREATERLESMTLSPSSRGAPARTDWREVLLGPRRK